MKTCTVCKQEKTLGSFGVRLASKDSYCASCLECQRKRDKIRWHKDKPKRLEFQRRYLSTKPGKEAKKRAVDNWNEHNKVKRAANQIVNSAIKLNRLTKSYSCSECEKGGRIHGHHDDYAHPLQVRWLCSKCHRTWHKTNEPLNG